jgi:hypothetical protein
VTTEQAGRMSPEEYAAHLAQADEQLSALAVMAGEPMAGYWPSISRRIEELLAYARQKESGSVWGQGLAV